MPPRGVKKGSKWERMYEQVKRSEQQEGRSEARAEEIAARTVNKERARAGETRQASRTSRRTSLRIGEADCARVTGPAVGPMTSSTRRPSTSASRGGRR